MSKANIMIQKNLIIPQLVVSHPVLNWNQKAILTLIIQHHQTHHDQRFTMKDKEIAKELGMKLGSVSTIIGQLFELGIIDKDVDSVQIQKGSKNKNVRYIWVESLDVWITGSQLPTITPRSQEELAERTKKQFKDVQEIDEITPIEPTSTTDTTASESKVDIGENDHIIASSEDYVSNRSDVAEFLEMYPNYHENQPFKVSFDFGDGDNIMDDVYFYKQVDGISKYISLSNIEDYKDGRGLYKKY